MSKKLVVPALAFLLVVLAAPALADANPTDTPAANPLACGLAGGALAATGLEGQEPRFASTCTECASCTSDADCGSGSCLSSREAPIVCEGEEVCSLPSQVCSLSCSPCLTSAQCPSGESCVPVQQAFCIAEEVCETVFPTAVCVCS